MAYSKRLTPEALSAIQPITERLKALKPGTGFNFPIEDNQLRERIRNWLYTYLRNNKLKPLYKIRVESLIYLSISRVVEISYEFQETAGLKADVSFMPTEEYVKDNLLDLKEETEVSAFLQEELSENRITDQQLLDYFEEWERVMS